MSTSKYESEYCSSVGHCGIDGDASKRLFEYEPTRIEFHTEAHSDTVTVTGTGRRAADMGEEKQADVKWAEDDVRNMMEIVTALAPSRITDASGQNMYEIEFYTRYYFLVVHVRFGVNGSGKRIVEWKRLSGDTMDACDLYRAFALQCVERFHGAKDVSGFSKERHSYVEKFNAHAADISDIKSPMQADTRMNELRNYLLSVWNTTKAEGCRNIARLCENAYNVSAFARHADIVQMLGNLLRDPSDTRLVVVSANALVNMIKASRTLGAQCVVPAGIMADLQTLSASSENAIIRAVCTV